MTQPPAPPTVLVVDDYQDNREMYAEYLGFQGFRVIEATNGMEALALAVSARPDVILMDLSLPGLDGWEATRRLKADPRTRHVPVIALSGHVMARHTQSALEAGCDDFLAKPCLPEAIVARLRAAIAAHPALETTCPP